MSEARFNTCIALIVGFFAALAAHAGGKPWWVDWPLLGDAFDVGILTAFSIRIWLWLLAGRDEQ